MVNVLLNDQMLIHARDLVKDNPLTIIEITRSEAGVFLELKGITPAYDDLTMFMGMIFSEWRRFGL